MKPSEQDLQRLKAWISESQRIVFFGGAGISTESGIPDFRSAEGIYNENCILSPEDLLSHSGLLQYPDLFFSFYRTHLIHPNAVPNAAHLALAALEQRGKLLGIITQNIDGLHQKAGNSQVAELHGSTHRNYCMSCKRRYDLTFLHNTQGIPHCHCGGTVRPDVVLFEESLDPDTMDLAIQWLKSADLLLVGGTSLSVYPAAGLLRYFRGEHLVLINKTPTLQDQVADLVIRGNIGEVFASMEQQNEHKQN